MSNVFIEYHTKNINQKRENVYFLTSKNYFLNLCKLNRIIIINNF